MVAYTLQWTSLALLLNLVCLFLRVQQEQERQPSTKLLLQDGIRRLTPSKCRDQLLNSFLALT
jgi:hypothetical protein